MVTPPPVQALLQNDLFGQAGGVIHTRTFGGDGDADDVVIALFDGFAEGLAVLQHGHLGVNGNTAGLCQHLIVFFAGEVLSFPIGDTVYGDGDGHDLNLALGQLFAGYRQRNRCDLNQSVFLPLY